MAEVPDLRIRVCNDAAAREDGDFVLYWMIAFRRLQWNFALQRAVEWARELKKPLVILEALRSDYRWASDRLHRFVLDGLADNARRLSSSPVLHHAYVETEPGAGRGLLAALGERAAAVVTDEYPAFFLPRMVAAAAERLPVRLEAVDSNGLLPLRAADRVYETAYAFRRFLQKNLREHLGEFPDESPLRRMPKQRLDKLPPKIARRWPGATSALLDDTLDLGNLPIDHSVEPAELSGGAGAGGAAWERFLEAGLSRYAEDRNHPDAKATTGLSPYLHFGHISTHQMFNDLMAREDWDTDQLAREARGKRSGWWGVGESAEALLDQFITWRELGFNMSSQREDYEHYESLPEWARKTLGEHLRDKRHYLYDLEAFETASTHDRVWNAAQAQLVQEGQLHNYMRMLWGKKILEWTATPQDALAVMIELNNKFALDGRDPNSYSGIFWCLGRYDRPWGPERPIFGKIRYMSSENTVRKLRISEYLDTYAP